MSDLTFRVGTKIADDKGKNFSDGEKIIETAVEGVANYPRDLTSMVEKWGEKVVAQKALQRIIREAQDAARTVLRKACGHGSSDATPHTSPEAIAAVQKAIDEFVPGVRKRRPRKSSLAAAVEEVEENAEQGFTAFEKIIQGMVNGVRSGKTNPDDHEGFYERAEATGGKDLVKRLREARKEYLASLEVEPA